MIANYMPWAPIVAFMVASPLTSPEELIYSAGLFGWPFALAFFAASIVLGLVGGAVASLFDRRGWLANQVRQSLATVEAAKTSAPPARHSAPVFAPASLTLEPACCAVETGVRAVFLPLEAVGCSCAAEASVAPARLSSPACACGEVATLPPTAGAGCTCAVDDVSKPTMVTLRTFLDEMFLTGKRLLVMFLSFAFIGYFLNGLIPAAWIAAIFGSGNAFSVPLAATLGLPLYINSEASLPLVRAMLDSGMSQGAALAFLITGAGTSFGAVVGMLTIARWRVVALVVGTLWVGAVLSGILYNLTF
jgi:uncharacterized membrane protein YraQ (UPF0718 family)